MTQTPYIRPGPEPVSPRQAKKIRRAIRSRARHVWPNAVEGSTQFKTLVVAVASKVRRTYLLGELMLFTGYTDAFVRSAVLLLKRVRARKQFPLAIKKVSLATQQLSNATRNATETILQARGALHEFKEYTKPDHDKWDWEKTGPILEAIPLPTRDNKTLTGIVPFSEEPPYTWEGLRRILLRADPMPTLDPFYKEPPRVVVRSETFQLDTLLHDLPAPRPPQPGSSELTNVRVCEPGFRKTGGSECQTIGSNHHLVARGLVLRDPLPTDHPLHWPLEVNPGDYPAMAQKVADAYRPKKEKV